MMQRFGAPTRASRISQVLRQIVSRPSFAPKVFLALLLIATGLFMAASDSATHASPLVPKKGANAGLSPTATGYPPANIVISDTTTPTAQATTTPTAGAPSNNPPTSGYTPPAGNTRTPTQPPTSTVSRPTSTPIPTATPTPQTSSSTNEATPTPTPTVAPTDTPTPTAVATDTPTPTVTVVSTDTPTVTPTDTPTSTVTVTPTDTPTVTPTVTVTPTNTPTVTPTPPATCITSASSTSTNANASTAQTRTTPQVASPLIFGTNLALFNAQDQVLTSRQAQACLQQMHISIIRMPIRSGLDRATIKAAAQMIKQVGATPLIVLHGSIDQNAFKDDADIIKIINKVFGKSIVYYEYGNNEDILQATTPQTYTDSWNANVLALKRLAPNGLFIGPVTHQYRPDYLQYFLQQAKPQPDVISWHEYACSSTQRNSTCFANLSNWKSHVQNARRLLNSTIKTEIPIMITEWNYAPNTTQNDGKNNDPIFMTSWTTEAIRTLVDSGVFASMQYAATNTNTNLIDTTNTLTAQGSTMQELYETLVSSSSSSSASAVTPTATPTPAATVTATPTPTATPTITPTDTPISDASAAAAPADVTIPPSSSAISEPE